MLLIKKSLLKLQSLWEFCTRQNFGSTPDHFWCHSNLFYKMNLVMLNNLLCILLILKQIKFTNQRRKRICWVRKIRSSHSQMLLNLGVLENFCKFHRKISVLQSLFNKIADLQIQQSCFLVKFGKVLRTPVFTEHLQWLLLENLFRSSRERRLPITGKIYAIIWQRLLLLLVQNVSSLGSSALFETLVITKETLNK